MAFCPPPDYVSLAVALCRRLSVYPLRRQAMAKIKGDEWRQILLEQRIQRWRDYYLSNREIERPGHPQRDVITNMLWNVAYDDTMIDFYAQLLGRAGLCPLKDGFPGQEKLSELCMQVDWTEREQLKGTLIDILMKIV